MKGLRISVGVRVLGLLLALAAGLSPASGGVTRPAGLHSDFDGDGYADLVVSAPYEDIGSEEGAGVVQVLYGAASDGLSGTNDQYWSEDHPELGGASEGEDWFGGALAVGDFDGDGWADLAVGVYGQEVGGHPKAGAVHVLYGSSPDGLTGADDQVWHQDSGTIHSIAEDGDRFGTVLAAGDFDGDGYADLAVGVPFEDWNLENSGVVQVLYGSQDGLTDAGNQLWRQGASGLPEAEEESDCFGLELATGDFDGDGYADLVVSALYEDIESVVDAGVVHVLYGSGDGLTAAGNQLWYEDLPSLEGASEGSDRFGRALAVGDFDGDGWADLAVGVYGQEVGGHPEAGAVHVLYGSSDGLTGADDQVWHQDSGTIHSVAEDGDHFGAVLTAGDFDGDGYADLAVGVAAEDWNLEDSGVVQVLYGSQDGLTDAGNQLWRQGASGLPEAEEEGDWFGHTLAAGDFDGDGCVDLAVGVVSEHIGSIAYAGVVHVLYGSVGGLVAEGNQLWYQGYLGVEGVAEAGDRFGWALAAIPVVRHKVYLPLVVRD